MDKEHQAIGRLQYAANVAYDYYKAPLIITYSGGKDSEVLLALALRAEIDFEVQHNHTTADAPETVQHIQNRFKQLEDAGIPCKRNMPRYKGKPTSMWDLIPQKMIPPTRIARYCCEVLKEQLGMHQCIATGVRWAESTRRAKNRDFIDIGKKDTSGRYITFADNDEGRQGFEACPIKGKTTINPIVDWTDADVWDFTRSEKLLVNPLYRCGFHRVGCIGCPMASQHRKADFERYPKYREMYLRAFGRMLKSRAEKGLPDFNGWVDAESVFAWWMRDPEFYGQQRIQGT